MHPGLPYHGIRVVGKGIQIEMTVGVDELHPAPTAAPRPLA
jgi:hypothetical protein